jgi:hypothetical protein
MRNRSQLDGAVGEGNLPYVLNPLILLKLM